MYSCVLNIKGPQIFDQITFQIWGKYIVYILKPLASASVPGGHSGGDTASGRNHQHEGADHGFLLPGMESS